MLLSNDKTSVLNLQRLSHVRERKPVIFHQLVSPYSEAVSDNRQWYPFTEKAKSFTRMVVIIFRVSTLRARTLGKSWERVQSWPIPQSDINYGRRSQDWLAKHELDWSLPCTLQTAGEKLPAWAQAACAHNSRYLQTQQGLAPGQGFQGQAGSVCFQRAAE